MVITYYGHEFFRVQFGDTVIAVNPISKESALKQGRFGADIVLTSDPRDPDCNGIDTVSVGDKKSFVVSGAGEYEVGGVFIKGLRIAPQVEGKKPTTIYWMLLENMRLCFLCGVSSKTVSNDVREFIGEVDILFVPIGGGAVLSAAEAHELSVSLEPHITIPMRVDASQTGKGSPLAQFLKESGVEDGKPLEKLTIKKKDVLESDGAIMVLSSSQ